MLVANKVSLKYKEWWGKDAFALKNVNLTINAGEEVGIVGPSGSGKSSLLYVLSGLKQPTEGEVLYQGNNLAELPDEERVNMRRNAFGFVFQEHFLINHLTATENILVPCVKVSGDVRERLEYLLQLLQIAELRDRFPWELSVGQKQRVAIARALINQPTVVFADEPTSSLDYETAAAVIALLKAYREKQGNTFILASHDKDLTKTMPRQIHLKQGAMLQVPSHA